MDNFKNIRTVEDILNLETGENITASVLLDNMESDDIVLLRRKLRTANREGKPILVCAECLTKLELRCNKLSRKNRGKDYYFFKHYKDVKECSIKTDSHLPVGVLLARKYENVKESIPHIELKNRLGYIIKQFHSPKIISIDSKFYFDKFGGREKRKPDVYAVIGDKEYAFEIQLNTTFLSVIEEREAFYERNNVSILWIFKNFPLEDGLQRLTQKDIYVPNRLNAFVLDNEMLNLSIERKKLHLRVYYKTFLVDGWKICSQWNTKIVTIEDLTYTGNCKPFFYDSLADKENAKRELERKKEEYLLEQRKIQKIQKQEQERLAKKEQVKKQKISRCRTLINTIQSNIDCLERQQSELLLKRKVHENQIEELEFKNKEISQILSDIIRFIEQMYDYLKKCSNQSWQYMSNPLGRYCDISHVKDIYCSKIQMFDRNKREIQTQLETEILPKKEFINKFLTQDIDGVMYSLIPPEKKYEWLIEKFPEEIKMIETKELGTIFASSYIKVLPNISFFRWCMGSKNNSNTFLMDMSSRKSKTLSKEKELNNQLDKISQSEKTCISELKNDIVQLLYERQNENRISISKLKSEINIIANIFSDCVTRIDILIKRKGRCYQYIESIQT
ncbi:DUF6035 family protein [Bacteroides fragilis]|uniref:DUF6035 family protein n=1 Tax=Bacteroides fragilis TaxID=817 RepID=UPI002810AAFE|nr:DUF6035 family protein [Bacteroides fragilis]WMI95151.1 hypothetical protein BFGS084_02573 [Bacteroides fragilis]